MDNTYHTMSQVIEFFPTANQLIDMPLSPDWSTIIKESWYMYNDIMMYSVLASLVGKSGQDTDNLRWFLCEFSSYVDQTINNQNQLDLIQYIIHINRPSIEVISIWCSLNYNIDIELILGVATFSHVKELYHYKILHEQPIKFDNRLINKMMKNALANNDIDYAMWIIETSRYHQIYTADLTISIIQAACDNNLQSILSWLLLLLKDGYGINISKHSYKIVFHYLKLKRFDKIERFFSFAKSYDNNYKFSLADAYNNNILI